MIIYDLFYVSDYAPFTVARFQSSCLRCVLIQQRGMVSALLSELHVMGPGFWGRILSCW